MRLPKEYLDNVEVYDDWVKLEVWYKNQLFNVPLEKYPLLCFLPLVGTPMLLELLASLKWDFAMLVVVILSSLYFLILLYRAIHPKYQRLKQYRTKYPSRLHTLSRYLNNFLSVVQSIQKKFSIESISEKISPQTVNIINDNHQIISSLMQNVNYVFQSEYKNYLKDYETVSLLIKKQNEQKAKQANLNVASKNVNNRVVLDTAKKNTLSIIESVKEKESQSSVVLDLPKRYDDNFNFLPPKEIHDEQDNTPKIPKPKVPTKRVRPNEITKVNTKDYIEEAIQKMEIGELGEKLVMQYERERVEREYGKAYLDRLQHSSKDVGDGLGYDIKSYDGREVYIEVKTTRKNKLNNIPITSNEVAVMEQLGDNYYLYIVSELDAESIDWKLNIYKGAERVGNLFELTPISYRLRSKN